MPATPYRGIQPFRYADHAIFLARDREARWLASLVDVYRGVFLYGASGNGKSSLVNAGLFPRARPLGFEPVRVRVQPRAAAELVIEPITGLDDEVLPCVLAPEAADSARVVLSIEDFEERVRSAAREGEPLLVFDQFEEILTLFGDSDALAMRDALVRMIVGLLRDDALAVKILFSFREDHLGPVKQLLAAQPMLVDQALRLGAPPAGTLALIIRGPFDRFPGHFGREIAPAVARQLTAALEQRFGSGEVSLSEVQTVCLRLWQADDAEQLLREKGVQGLLEDDLGEVLDAFAPDLRHVAVALLSQMVTPAGTRNVISAQDLRQRVLDEEPGIAPALIGDALDRLERSSKLVRRERRRELYLYEITSEFLVPWISRRREDARRTQDRRREEEEREHERARERRRLRVLATIAAGLLVVVALVTVLAVWALNRGAEARRQASNATSLALSAAAQPLFETQPEYALLLAFEGYRESPRVEARGAVIAALETVGSSPVVVGVLRGHAGAVNGVAFSPDDHLVASAGADGTVRLWDARTHVASAAPMRGHRGPVLAVTFAANGRLLASAGADGTVRLWDVRTHERVGGPLRGHRGAVLGLASAADGRLASAGEDGTVRVWDTRTHAQVGRSLRGHRGPVKAVALAQDGRRLASAGVDGTVRVWDPATHAPIGGPLRGHRGPVLAVAFSPDGRRIASGGVDATILLWDAASRRRIGSPLRGHAGPVTGVAFGPDGRVLASSGLDLAVRLWDTGTSTQLTSAVRAAGAVNGVAFSADGRTVASAGADRTIELRTTRTTGDLGTVLAGHADRVSSVAFSPNGRLLASASADRTIRLWDTRTHQPAGAPLRGHTGAVHAVAFSSDGHVLASGSADHTVRLWDGRSGNPLGAALRGHDGSVVSVALAADGRTLASGSDDGTVRLWDVRSHRQLGRPLRVGAPTRVAISPDGQMLATVSSVFVTLWNAHTHALLGHAVRRDAHAIGSVAFSPDGSLVATGSLDAAIRLWHTHPLEQIGVPMRGHEQSVTGVAFSPDGRTLASASADRTVWLWDVRTHKPLGTRLPGHSKAVSSVAFSPDGRTLASGSDDRTVRVWRRLLWRTDAELRDRVCGLFATRLGRAAWAQYAAGIPYRRSCH